MDTYTRFSLIGMALVMLFLWSGVYIKINRQLLIGIGILLTLMIIIGYQIQLPYFDGIISQKEVIVYE